MALPFTHQAGHGTTTLACKLEPYEFTKALQHKSVLYVGGGEGQKAKIPSWALGQSAIDCFLIFFGTCMPCTADPWLLSMSTPLA